MSVLLPFLAKKSPNETTFEKMFRINKVRRFLSQSFECFIYSFVGDVNDAPGQEGPGVVDVNSLEHAANAAFHQKICKNFEYADKWAPNGQHHVGLHHVQRIEDG